MFSRLCDQRECEADDAIAKLERQQGRRGLGIGWEPTRDKIWDCCGQEPDDE